MRQIIILACLTYLIILGFMTAKSGVLAEIIKKEIDKHEKIVDDRLRDIRDR